MSNDLPPAQNFPLGYGLSDKPGYTLEDYRNGTSIWHVHQDTIQYYEEERKLKHFRPDLFTLPPDMQDDGNAPSASDKGKDDEKANSACTPELGKNSYAMSPYILCCSLFAITTYRKKQTPRAYYEKTIQTMNGGSIDYRGKELWQEDLSVLLGLLKLAQGKGEDDLKFALDNPEHGIRFAPTSFCSSIGWSDNTENIGRLKECLLRLRQAVLVLRRDSRDGEFGSTVGFVSDFKWEGDRRWTVMLHPRIVGLFSTHFSYINVLKRKLLSEGMQSWLYGVICANNCHVPFKYMTLYQASGSKAESLKEFGRSVRAALMRMQELNIIKGFKQERGAVRIFK